MLIFPKGEWKLSKRKKSHWIKGQKWKINTSKMTKAMGSLKLEKAKEMIHLMRTKILMKRNQKDPQKKRNCRRRKRRNKNDWVDHSWYYFSQPVVIGKIRFFFLFLVSRSMQSSIFLGVMMIQTFFAGDIIFVFRHFFRRMVCNGYSQFPNIDFLLFLFLSFLWHYFFFWFEAL